MRVLLIEDNHEHATLIGRAMQRDTVVERVACLQQALQHPSLGSFDLVLCDLSLPDATGVETVVRIRDRAADLPLVVLTHWQDEHVAMEAVEAGAQDYLVKTDALLNSACGRLTLQRTIRSAAERQTLRIQELRLVQELRSSQQLLEQKNRRLEELYATAHRSVDNVSHEFRTPLTVIKEYASLMREGLAGQVTDEQARMLNVIEDRADDLNTIVDDMLDVSKLEAGLLGVCRKACQLSEVMAYVMPPLQRKASVRNVCLEVAVPSDVPPVWCDEEKVGRVLINLVVNAIKFSGNPGVVRIWAQRDDRRREVVVGVNDNGPGIPRDKLSEIFERFRQPVTSLRQCAKGFGLGLNIAKELVDLNLGHLEVKSDGRQGSEFTFTLPYAEPEVVLGRQLQRLRQNLGPEGEICFALLTSSDSRDERELRDFELFLQQGLRPYDQLFRIGPTRWLAALAISSVEFPLFVERLRTEHQQLSRNRPRGPLLDWEATCEATWRLGECRDELLQQTYVRCALGETAQTR